MHKQCIRCGESKHLEEFPKARGSKREGRCKLCKHERQKERLQADPVARERRRRQAAAWRERNPGAAAASVRASYQRHKLKQTQERRDRYRAEKHKDCARAAVQFAIRRLELPPVTERACLQCGGQAQHYHHWSYLKQDWLDVMPLCRRCHKRVHRSIIALEPEDVLEDD